MRKVVLNQVSFSKDDLSEIHGCFVSGLTDGVNEDGDEVIFLTFFNPVTKNTLARNLENMDVPSFQIHMRKGGNTAW